MKVQELEQRKEDLRNRINALVEELQPLQTKCKQFEHRIGSLELDFRNVLDQLREAQKSR